MVHVAAAELLIKAFVDFSCFCSSYCYVVAMSTLDFIISDSM